MDDLLVLKAVLRLIDAATFKETTATDARNITVIRDAFAKFIADKEESEEESDDS